MVLVSMNSTSGRCAVQQHQPTTSDPSLSHHQHDNKKEEHNTTHMISSSSTNMGNFSKISSRYNSIITSPAGPSSSSCGTFSNGSSSLHTTSSVTTSTKNPTAFLGEEDFTFGSIGAAGDNVGVHNLNSAPATPAPVGVSRNPAVVVEYGGEDTTVTKYASTRTTVTAATTCCTSPHTIETMWFGGDTTTSDNSRNESGGDQQTSCLLPPPCDHIQVAIRIRPIQRQDVESPFMSPTIRRSGSLVMNRRGSSGIVPISSSYHGRTTSLTEEQHVAWSVDRGDNNNNMMMTMMNGCNSITNKCSFAGYAKLPSMPSSVVMSQRGVGRKVCGRTMFSFDCVLDQDTDTEAVYEQVAKPIIHGVAAGRNGTIFAYGQTGSGKTYTMQGTEVASSSLLSSSGENMTNNGFGIIQFAATDLFSKLEDQKPSRAWKVRAQYFEIYNEKVIDLLIQQRSTNEDGVRQRLLPVSLGASALNVVEEEVSCVDDVVALLNRGNRNRSVAATNANAQSSRSHAIFQMTVTSRNKDVLDDQVVRVSTLNMVDLAGSENSTAAGVVGLRKRESGKINQSLLSLSRVIHSLSLPEKKRPKHIGYRDSKLTRILQPHLSGNACLAILCCVSAARKHLEETRSTLKFADDAKRIVVKPTVNEVVDEQQVLQVLRKELSETREALFQLQLKMTNSRLQQQQQQQQQQKQQRSVRTPSVEESDVETDEDYPMAIGGKFSINSDEGSMISAGSSGVIEEMEDDDIDYSTISYASSSRPDGPPREIVVMGTKDGQEQEQQQSGAGGAENVANDNGDTKPDTEELVKVMSEKMNATDELVEWLTRELQELETSNAELDDHNRRLRRGRSGQGSVSSLFDEGNTTTRVDDPDLLVQQFLLLKYSIVVGLIMYFAGHTEFFLATIIFLWLTLEVATR